MRRKTERRRFVLNFDILDPENIKFALRHHLAVMQEKQKDYKVELQEFKRKELGK
jgi:hypothetical protein